MTADEMVEKFWEWRKRGRMYQTLRLDLEYYLTAWQPEVGWQVCSEVHRRVMAREKWDIAQGGLPARGPAWHEVILPPPLPPVKTKKSPFRKSGPDGKGGLIAR